MKTKIFNMLFIMMLCLLPTSCEHSNSLKRINPTAPVPGTAHANFYASQASSEGYGVYKGDSSFHIQAPAGDYLLTYEGHGRKLLHDFSGREDSGAEYRPAVGG